MLTGIAGFVLGLSTLVVWDRVVRAWQRRRFRREGWSSTFPGTARWGR